MANQYISQALVIWSKMLENGQKYLKCLGFVQDVQFTVICPFSTGQKSHLNLLRSGFCVQQDEPTLHVHLGQLTLQ